MGEGVKAKIQNLLTRAHARRHQHSVIFHSLEAGRAGASKPRARSSIVDSAEPIATTAAATICRLVRRAPTHIEAVRNLGCDTASTLVSATKMMRFKKNDVNRVLCSDGHSV